MARVVDATFSIYTIVNSFAKSIGFKFVSTTSVETAASVMMDGTDKLILVQTKVEDKTFLDMEYKIFVSFANSTEVNSIRESEIISSLIELFPAFSKVCIYEAEGLKQAPSIYNNTGKALVVISVGQDVVSITQMRNNLSCVVVKLSGYIK